MDLKTFSFHIWISLYVIMYHVCNCFEGSTGFYADNGLGQTVLINRLPGRQRREMQQEILTLLGLHHRPRPSRRTKAKSAPKFMIDLYESLWKDSEDMHTTVLNRRGLHVNISDNAAHHIDHADMIMSFVNQVAHHKYIKRDLNRRFYFDFAEVPATEVVTEAELRIYKSTITGRSRKSFYTVNVYNVKQGQDLEDRLLELQSSLRVPASHEGWLEFEVQEAARQWHRPTLPNTNLGLFMRVLDAEGVEVRPSSIGIVDLMGPEEQQAFMVGCFKSGAKLHQRSKRASGNRRKNSGVTYAAEEPRWSYMRQDRYNTRTCQKKNLYVSFRELGWQDWIIAPDGYAAFYCYGECSFPLNAHMNATNHAIVQTLVHLMNPYTVPKPCCTPTELSGISVLFFDEKSNVILRKYANMVVQACGCH